MSEEVRPAADLVADGLAYVCRRLDDISGLLPKKKQALVSQVLAAVRAGQDPAGPLQALHIALQVAGDHLGVWGHRGEPRGPNMTGINRHQPLEPFYPCPLSRCSGRQVDQSTVFPLVCAITGRELRRERL